MNKDLVVGDLHIQIGNLEESQNLLWHIADLFVTNKCRNLIILGDVFHTHSVIRQEVAYMVRDFFKEFFYNIINADKSRIIILAGNHDGISPTDASKNACDLILSEFTTVVSDSKGVVYKDGFVFLPFIHNTEDFVKNANLSFSTAKAMGVDDPVLFCHQTFDGAAYESGTLAPGGVKSDAVLFTTIISGHIHTRQLINEKVVYVGTPRAITSAECNMDKFVHIVYRDKENNKITFVQFSTRDVVKNYYKININEEDPGTHTLDLSSVDIEKDSVIIRISGTEYFFNQIIEQNKHLCGKVKFIPVITKNLSKIINLEQTGDTVEKSLEVYVKTVADIDLSIKDEVWETLQTMMN